MTNRKENCKATVVAGIIQAIARRKRGKPRTTSVRIGRVPAKRMRYRYANPLSVYVQGVILFQVGKMVRGSFHGFIICLQYV
jgi:hypothetical protein